jgi:hypothetical protein
MTTDGYRRPIPAHSSGWLREWHRPLERGRDDGDGRPDLPPSLVIGIEGHKGAGKTALSVALARDLGLRGFSVVSNTPLHLPKGIPVRTVDRGLDAVLDVCMDLVGKRNTVLLIDEAHVVLAAGAGVSNLSKLVAAAVGQSRKVRLWVIYTTLLVHWVESRLRAMTDLVARVTDAAVLGITARRGEMALVQWYDHSGIVTGRVGGYPMGETLFRVRQVWKLFDTYAVRDPSEALARVEFRERPVAQVTLGGTGNAAASRASGGSRSPRARDDGRPPSEALVRKPTLERLPPLRERIRDCLRAGATTVAEIASALSCPENSVYQTLKRWEGRIFVRVQAGRETRWELLTSSSP